ncbi:MAG TPA: hypothetical protein VG795_02175 [Acidimicrobiia bacterium]|nr:hypothetical protein [Acidimicrobiia bacterium]
MEGREPDARPHVQGASRGKGDRRDAERAGGDTDRAEASNEYAANARPGEEGHRKQGGHNDTAAADLDPHEPPGQG